MFYASLVSLVVFVLVYVFMGIKGVDSNPKILSYLKESHWSKATVNRAFRISLAGYVTFMLVFNGWVICLIGSWASTNAL